MFNIKQLVFKALELNLTKDHLNVWLFFSNKLDSKYEDLLVEVKHITIIFSIAIFWEMVSYPSSVKKFKNQYLFLEYEVFKYFKTQIEYSHEPGDDLNNLPIQKFLTSLLYNFQLSLITFFILQLTFTLWTGVSCSASLSDLALYYLFLFQLIFFLLDAFIWTLTLTLLVVWAVFLFF